MNCPALWHFTELCRSWWPRSNCLFDSNSKFVFWPFLNCPAKTEPLESFGTTQPRCGSTYPTRQVDPWSRRWWIWSLEEVAARRIKRLIGSLRVGSSICLSWLAPRPRTSIVSTAPWLVPRHCLSVSLWVTTSADGTTTIKRTCTMLTRALTTTTFLTMFSGWTLSTQITNSKSAIRKLI